MHAHISDSNGKLGNIPNISMLPITACNHDAPCRAKGQCYAIKFLMYKNVKTAWSENTELASTDRNAYFSDIASYLAKKQPRHFRWHVAGDILDQDYLTRMIDIAMEYPETRFLAFTKMFSLDYSNIPGNAYSNNKQD